jgi:hypothetical protein
MITEGMQADELARAGVDIEKWRRLRNTRPPVPDALLERVVRRVLPPGWVRLQDGPDGALYQSKSQGLGVIASVAQEMDGRWWHHVSLSRRSRMPSWDDVRHVKDVFIGRDRKAIQVLPAEAEYVNYHPFCLHLWSCFDDDPLPDFTHGLGTI